VQCYEAKIANSLPIRTGNFFSEAGKCWGKNRDWIGPSESAEGPVASMSALPPKADMCGALAGVCFGPIADIRLSTPAIHRGPRANSAAQSERLRSSNVEGHLKSRPSLGVLL